MSYVADWLFDTLAQAEKDVSRVVHAITPIGGIYGKHITDIDYTNRDASVVVMKPIDDEKNVLVAIEKTQEALKLLDEAIIFLKSREK